MLHQQLSCYALALLRRAVPKGGDNPLAACTELFAAAAATSHRALHSSAFATPPRYAAASLPAAGAENSRVDSLQLCSQQP